MNNFFSENNTLIRIKMMYSSHKAVFVSIVLYIIFLVISGVYQPYEIAMDPDELLWESVSAPEYFAYRIMAFGLWETFEYFLYGGNLVYSDDSFGTVNYFIFFALFTIVKFIVVKAIIENIKESNWSEGFFGKLIISHCTDNILMYVSMVAVNLIIDSGVGERIAGLSRNELGIFLVIPLFLIAALLFLVSSTYIITAFFGMYLGMFLMDRLYFALDFADPLKNIVVFFATIIYMIVLMNVAEGLSNLILRLCGEILPEPFNRLFVDY